MTTPLAVGAAIPVREVIDLTGTTVPLPLAGRALTHLQFRRFAGCPICNLHLRDVATRIHELRAAGVDEVAVFRSDAETMRPYQGDLPFTMVPDGDLALTRAFGVERSSLRAIADPSSWLAAMKGMVGPFASNALGSGDHFALPAGFLIDASGVVVASKLGVHADDQWSVDELFGLAARHGPR